MYYKINQPVSENDFDEKINLTQQRRNNCLIMILVNIAKSMKALSISI